jgi:nucleoid-associated protein YgaU
MRKEVKLGMAIGGGLIALLVVYLLVAPPANNKKGTQLVGGQSIIDPQSGDPGPAVDDKTAAAKATNDPAAGTPNTAGNPNPPIVQTEASKQPEVPKAADDKGKAAPAPGAGGGDQWKILQTGKGTKPLVQTTTPSGNQVDKEPSKRLEKREPVTLAEGRAAPQPSNPEPKLYYNPNDAWGGGVNTPETAFGTIAHNTRSALSTGGGSAAQGGGSPGTHVVREGETFSSIAQTVYGSAAYYPHLIRANPDVNPNNLKLGAVIKVPRIDEVKATAGEHAAAGDKATASATEPKIDTSKQYRVVANDSLYKISLKLYGKSTYVDKLYEKNKAAIGPDPKKLKLGMVLDLPDKTTVAAGEVADQTNSTVIQGPGVGDEQSR